MTKTILITGSTDGIGLLTAKMLATDGHTILIHGRSAEKLSKACEEIEATTGIAVTAFSADLSDLGATRALADNIKKAHGKLDILINNAGVLKTPSPVLPNGQDVRFVVNTLAPYLLTKELLPIIPKDGRVLNLSSAAQAPVDLAALKGEKYLDDMSAYAQSKLAITIWTQEWAKHLPDGPAMIAVNPGSLLASKMVKEGFGIAGNDLSIGANILHRLAIDAEFAAASGRYWDNDAGKFNNPNSAANDEAHCAAIMAEIETLTT